MPTVRKTGLLGMLPSLSGKPARPLSPPIVAAVVPGTNDRPLGELTHTVLFTNALAFPICTVPLLMVVPPVKVLLLLMVTSPPPETFMVAVPAMPIDPCTV